MRLSDSNEVHVNRNDLVVI